MSTTKSPLGMSDEDFLKQPLDSFEESSQQEEESIEEPSTEEETPEEEAETEVETEEEIPESSNEEDPAIEEEQDKKEDSEEPLTDAEAKKDTQEVAEQASKDTEDKTDLTSIQEEHKQIFAPFKANGREMKVESVDDIRKLMQMGANYNKKMIALKPSLKVVRMLEKNDLLDEEKLSFLIDVNKKNPEAIKKLLKDSEIDPLDIDTTEESSYKPNNYRVNDTELALEQALEDIKDSAKYSETLNVVGKQWDAESQSEIADNPELIGVINEHLENGIFTQISQNLERERVLGNLNGLSDLQAYKQIGDAINARGGFNHLFGQTQPQSKSPTNTVDAKTEVDPQLARKRKAVGSTKGTSPKKKSTNDLNPLAMSDEEFEKAFLENFS